MSAQLPRWSLFLTGALAFLTATFAARTSAPASDTSLPPADPTEVAFLDELSAWLAAPPPPPGNFRLFQGHGAVLELPRRPGSFDLFKRLATSEAGQRLVTRVPYGTSILESAKRHQVDALLFASVVEAESNFNPRAISSQGAVGLAQVMPFHEQSLTLEALKDPKRNLDVGARYLREMLDRSGGDPAMALAAYNAGPNAVERWQGVPPYAETRTFVSRVLGIYHGHHQELRAERQLGVAGPMPVT